MSFEKSPTTTSSATGSTFHSRFYNFQERLNNEILALEKRADAIANSELEWLDNYTKLEFLDKELAKIKMYYASLQSLYKSNSNAITVFANALEKNKQCQKIANLGRKQRPLTAFEKQCDVSQTALDKDYKDTLVRLTSLEGERKNIQKHLQSTKVKINKLQSRIDFLVKKIF